jgi:hypothetical protein
LLSSSSKVQLALAGTAKEIAQLILLCLPKVIDLLGLLGGEASVLHERREGFFPSTVHPLLAPLFSLGPFGLSRIRERPLDDLMNLSVALWVLKIDGPRRPLASHGAHPKLTLELAHSLLELSDSTLELLISPRCGATNVVVVLALGTDLGAPLLPLSAGFIALGGFVRISDEYVVAGPTGYGERQSQSDRAFHARTICQRAKATGGEAVN